MNKALLVSVVVPAYRCKKTISETIQAILNQSCPSLELIVVDDGSQDETTMIIQSFPQVKYIFQDNAGPASARNHGAFETKGEFIFFTDSDCIPHRDWIEMAMRYFGDPQVAVVAGSYDIANPEFILARCIHKEIMYRHHQLMPMHPKSFGSYNFGVRKKVFMDVGGFDTGYRYASGEDNDLSYKIIKAGYKIYFAKDTLVKHFHTTQINKYLYEQSRHGFWRVKMYIDHPSMAWGDDYTFWKDMVEVPLVYTGIMGLILRPWLFHGLAQIGGGAFTVLYFIELFYSFLMIKDFGESLYYSFVMFLRAFARVLGLTMSILNFFFNNSIKKSK